MKLLMLTACMAAISAPAVADTCSDLAELSATIADMRDAGVPLSKALDALGSVKARPEIIALIRTLTVQGYASDMSAADFYINVDAACRKALGDGA